MSKKKLLSENEIRRFQGLAGIPALGEMHCPSGEREEDEVEEGMHDGARHEDEEEMEEGMHDGEREEDMDMGDEPMDMDMDVEMDASDKGGDLDLSPDQKEDLAADIVRAVAQELSAALDLDEPIEVETDGDAGADLDMDMDMGGDDEELDLDLGDEPEEEGDAPGMRYMEEEEEPLEEEEGAFAPSHYCVHHGGVQHEGKFKLAEAVGHNWSEEEGRVTHYDMKLEDGTVLENVAFEDIQVTNASLAEAHHAHKAKRHSDEEEELDESTNDDLVNEVLRRVVKRLSNK